MARILVVGASRGIGAALVEQLAARGDQVIATVRSAPAGLPSTAEWVDGVDVALAAGRARLAAALAGRAIDVLLHNAGILQDDSLQSLLPEALQRQMEVNAFAPLLLVRELLPNLQPGARIAFLTSRMGSIADNSSGSHYGYRMSKAALNMAARSLAIDLQPRGISVALLHPGFVRTTMTGGQGQLEPAQSAALLIQRIDALQPADSGGFWHANGERLPW